MSRRNLFVFLAIQGIILLIVLYIFSPSCSKKKKVAEKSIDKDLALPTNILEYSEQESELSGFHLSSEEREQILSVIDFKLGEPIRLDSPKRFIQIAILFTMSQSANYYKISKKNRSDDEISAYMNQQRNSFYKKLGISEETYISYASKHHEEIMQFLDKKENIAFEKAYNTIQNQITD